MPVIFLCLTLLASWALLAYVVRILEHEKLDLSKQVQSLRRKLVEEPASQELQAAMKHPSRGLDALEGALERVLRLASREKGAFDEQGELLEQLCEAAAGLLELKTVARMPGAQEPTALQQLVRKLAPEAIVTTQQSTDTGTDAQVLTEQEQQALERHGPLLAALLREEESGVAQRRPNFATSSRRAPLFALQNNQAVGRQH